MIWQDRTAEIEAHQWDGTVACLVKLRNWYTGHGPCPDGPNMVAAKPDRPRGGIDDGFYLEPGDWLIRNISGNFWSMDPDDFTNFYKQETPDVDV